MSDPVFAALIVFASTLPASIYGYYDRRKIKAAVADTHRSINSRMDELLATARELARMQGQAEGREQGVTERASRVAESERVEDREATKPHV